MVNRVQVLVILLLILVFTNANSAIYHVHLEGNDENDGLTWYDAFATLQMALDASSSGDEIWVARGTYYPTSDYGLEMGPRGRHFRIKPGVKLYGGFPTEGDPILQDRNWEKYETILSGDHNNDDSWIVVSKRWVNRSDNSIHVFYHPQGTNLDSNAVIDGFTIFGGVADNTSLPYQFSSGGGIFSDGGSPMIRNVHFRGNSALQDGGALWTFNQQRAYIVNCLFTQNTANEGGALKTRNTHIKSTRFVNNNANWGGGIIVNNSIVEDCVFTYNTAINEGGAIYSSYDSEIINGDFSYNSAYRGGAISNFFNDDLTIRNGDFRKNKAVFGGAVSNVRSNPLYIDCIFTENEAQRGGAFDNEDRSNPRILNSHFELNTAENGGAIYCFENSRPTIDECLFRENYVTKHGGAIYLMASNVEISNSLFIENKAIIGGAMWKDSSDTKLTNCHFIENDAELGGAVYNLNSASTFDDCKFWDNTAEYGGAVYSLGKDYTVTNSDFEGNQAIMGSALYNYKISPNIYRSFFSKNKGDYAAVYNLDNQAKINECIFYDNYGYIQGGAILNENSPIQVLNSIFEKNISLFGGAIFNDRSNAIIENTTFEYNNSFKDGGAIYSFKSLGKVIGCLFLKNHCTEDYARGGAIRLDSSKVIIEFTEFNGNRADSGGAVYFSGFAPKMNNLDFIKNIGFVSGGALCVQSVDYELTNTRFVSNMSNKEGGAITNYYSHCVYRNILVENSHCIDSGAGMKAYYSKIEIYDSEFKGNYTNYSIDAMRGGAMYLFRTDSEIHRTKITNNRAHIGGGMYIHGGKHKFVNLLIADNSSNLAYGGIAFVKNAEAVLTNCTISGNNAKNGAVGGIHIDETSNVTLNNSILWGNIAGFDPQEAQLDSGITNRNSLTLNYCNYRPGELNMDGQYTANYSMYHYPHFTYEQPHPYLLNGISPLVDAGYDMYIDDEYDVRGRGFPRKLNKYDGNKGTVDIGAYEYRYGVDPVSVSESELIAESVSIYPNPGTGKFTLSLTSTKDMRIRMGIYSLAGSLMFPSIEHYLSYGENSIQVSAEELSSGNYHLLVDFEDGSTNSYKLIIQK